MSDLFIDYIRRIISPFASKFLTRAMIVEGNLKGTETRFKSLVVGDTYFTRHLVGRMYEGRPDILRSWRVWIPSLKKMIAENSAAFDLCIAVLPFQYEKYFEGSFDFKSTELVHQIIDTSGSWEDVRSGFASKKYQITNRFSEKYNLDYRVSKELSDLDFFYYRMFVPHIQRRYGDMSMIEPYEEVKKFFLQGMLLFVTKGSEEVAGALSLVKDGKLIFRRTGVLDGDESHVEAGAQTALYYFQLKYANDNGLQAVDTMLSDPFLNDGVFRHKKEWGAAVFSSDEEPTRVFLFHSGSSEKLAKFYEQNPIIVQTDMGLKGLIGISEETELSDKKINDLIKRYRSKGLHGFILQTNNGIRDLPS